MHSPAHSLPCIVSDYSITSLIGSSLPPWESVFLLARWCARTGYRLFTRMRTHTSDIIGLSGGHAQNHPHQSRPTILVLPAAYFLSYHTQIPTPSAHSFAQKDQQHPYKALSICFPTERICLRLVCLIVLRKMKLYLPHVY